MTRIIFNLLTFLDILVNKETYLRQMRGGGFVVSEGMTRRELYLFFRK